MLSFFWSAEFANHWTVGDLVSTFVIEGLEWSKWKGPVITSVYWGAFGVSRILAIFVTRCACVTPKRFVFSLLSLITATFICLIFVTDHEYVTWICFALIAAAQAPVTAAVIVFVSHVITPDGPVTTVISISASVSMMVSATVCGFMFDVYGHMSILYYFLANSVLSLVSFIAMVVLRQSFQRAAQKILQMWIRRRLNDCDLAIRLQHN